MEVRTTLTGTSPVMFHNIQLADPDNYYAKEIRKLTSKRTKTEEDRREIARLEWFGGLYVNEGRIVVPTANIRKCFQEAAKVTRAGKQVERAVNAIGLHVPLAYNGPKDLEELWGRDEFHDITVVGVGQARVVRCRPVFVAWMCEVVWDLVTEIMDLDDFARVVAKAGKIEGLGDNRTGGYGRFTTEIAPL